MWWRSLLAVSVFLVAAATFVLLYERQSFEPTPAANASRLDRVTLSNLYAGGAPAVDMPEANTREELSGFDVSQGKRLYHWFNCVGCHANGGGDIGPALMDDKWLYGAAPRNIFAAIVEGRPNGMPSFRGKIPDEQVWQIVAYVRSMSGQVPIHALPGRNDDLSAKPPETMAPVENPVESGSRTPDTKATSP
jgi:cytochrome c oxidase cbb3-type subunit 3